MRPPPSSTLFPYTTLFRSGDAVQAPERAAIMVFVVALDQFEGQGVQQPRPAVKDRKSTRLNSSHMSISYAVFCLKKKNSSSSIYGQAEAYPTPERPASMPV